MANDIAKLKNERHYISQAG